MVIWISTYKYQFPKNVIFFIVIQNYSQRKSTKIWKTLLKSKPHSPTKFCYKPSSTFYAILFTNKSTETRQVLMKNKTVMKSK